MKSALLVMDAQNITLQSIPNYSDILKNINQLIEAARAAAIPVIFVKVGFRSNYPEIHESNIVFSTIKNYEIYQYNQETSNIHSEIAYSDDDIIVHKKRISAFSGSDLEIILRSKKIESLILTGFWTSGVVLSTLFDAFDRDYSLTVIEDGCGEPSDEIHQFLMKNIFPNHAEVTNKENFIASLSSIK